MKNRKHNLTPDAQFKRWWKSRPRYNFGNMPTALLIIIGTCSLAVATWGTPQLYESWGDFWRIAQTMPPFDWGSKGWLFLGILSVFSFYIGFFAAMGARCKAILLCRVFA